MSVLIKDMEMPITCADCRLSTVNSFNNRPLCDVLVEYMSYGEWEAKRLDNCPLIAIPPHGRLIEKERLYNKLAVITSDVWVLEEVNNAPTIIEAEGEEHEHLTERVK